MRLVLVQAAMAARERQHQEQMHDASALHREQLAAYHRIEQEGGTLHALASEVKSSSQVRARARAC
eukprot:933190-Pleurochrysis_carterae.AAC.1